MLWCRVYLEREGIESIGWARGRVGCRVDQERSGMESWLGQREEWIVAWTRGWVECRVDQGKGGV